MRKIEVSGAVLYDEDGNVFVAKRPKGKVLADKWEFPGGKKESKESLEECLKREILEELNVKIKIKDYIGHESYEYDYAKITLHLYACKLEKGETPKLLEHQDFKWISLRDIHKLDMPEIVHLFMDKIRASIESSVKIKKLF